MSKPPITIPASPASAPPAPPSAGRMIIDLVDNGSSRPTPSVSFAPVGRFTPGLINDYVPLFAREIDRAQAAVRQAAARAEKESAQ